MKKFLSLLVCASLVTAFVGQTAFSVTVSAAAANPVKLKVMAAFRPQHADFKDMPIAQQITKDANVSVTWELVPDNAINERKNIAISTGDLPDIFLGMVTDADVSKNTSMFVPISNYLDKAPNFSKILKDDARMKPFLTYPDGKIYSFPFWHDKEYEGLLNDFFINKTWLDALKLQIPNTYKEYEEVLKKFKNNDPNGNGKKDELPYSFIVNHDYFGLWSMYAIFGRIDNPNRLVIENGKVLFTANKEEWKNATIWLASLYSQGLIDVESFTQDRTAFFAKGKLEPTVIGSLNVFLIDNVVGAKKGQNEYIGIKPLEGVNGKRYTRFNPNPIANRVTGVISAKSKEINGAIKFLDTCIDESKEYSIFNTYGILGKQLIASKDSNYKYEFATAPDGMSQDDFRFKDAPASFPAYIPTAIYSKLKPAPDVARKIVYMNEVRPYFWSEWLPPVMLTEAEAKENSTIWPTINDYVYQQQALWISGKSDINKDWDAYVAKLKSMNVDKYVAIQQAAMDRYNGK